MNAYELALTYNALGWNVIPIGKNSKVPTCDFKEYIDRPQSQTDIFELFSEHTGNIALLTGKVSGIVAVDMDTYKENYSGINIFSPLSVKSPRGGKHLYFRYEEGQGNEAELKGIGIRSTGYYVVLPPSMVDGKSYEWESVPSTELIKNLPPLPKNLLDAFTVKPGQSKSKNLIEFVGLKEGESREVNMHAVACKLYNQYSWEETVAICQGINKTYVPPLDDKEFLHALKGVKEHIDANPKEKWDEKKAKEEAQKKVSLMKPEKKERRDFKNEKRYSWGTYILDHSFAIIKDTNFIVFGAKRSSGKTTFAYDMAMKNARDFGHRVLFVSLEMDEKDILDDFGRKKSAMRIGDEFDKTVPSYTMEAYTRRIDEIEGVGTLIFKGMRRSEDVTWEMIEAIILAQPVDMVFIDNLDRIAGNKGESDYDRQKRITTKTMGFASENHIPIIMIHHYRKSGKEDKGMDELAGSGKIADNADRIIRVIKNFDPEAPYPDKYKSEVYLQKGRGYPECKKNVFFIDGTFVDTPPINENEPRIQHALDLMGGTIIDN